MYLPRGLGDSGLVASLASAIGRFEGFLVPGSVAQRNNNPGNLRSGPGQTGTDANGYAIFPDVATGQAALQNQIQLNIDRGLSLQQFFAGEPGVYAGYAPASDKNNPTQYANTVAGWLGIDPSVPLQSLDAGAAAAASDLAAVADSATSEDGTAGLSTMAVVALALVAVGVVWWAAS
jgi:hypothetical protein